jgi:hypothetical protein
VCLPITTYSARRYIPTGDQYLTMRGCVCARPSGISPRVVCGRRREFAALASEDPGGLTLITTCRPCLSEVCLARARVGSGDIKGLGRLCWPSSSFATGETVVDVPATLSARTRGLSGHSGRKTDEFDARSVAIAAAGNRRWYLVSHRQKTSCQLQALLAELQPGGAKLHLSIAQATKLVASLRR